MDSKHYYTGEGVLHHKGKDIEHGQALPADLPAETVARMVKKGKASTTPPSQPGAAEASELGRLRDKVLALTVERDNASEAASAGSLEIARLQDELATVTGERDAARDSVVNLEQTVAQLTAQLTGTTPAPVEAEAVAGPGKKK